MATSSNTNSEPCICYRPTCRIICMKCAEEFYGRCCRVCIVHPHKIWLSDFANCVVRTCRSEALLECTGIDKFHPILPRKVVAAPTAPAAILEPPVKHIMWNMDAMRLNLNVKLNESVDLIAPATSPQPLKSILRKPRRKMGVTNNTTVDNPSTSSDTGGKK